MLCFLIVIFLLWGCFLSPIQRYKKDLNLQNFFHFFLIFFFSEFHTAGRRRRKKYSHLDITSEWEQDIMKKVVIQSL